jgi:hypothetical protein
MNKLPAGYYTVINPYKLNYLDNILESTKHKINKYSTYYSFNYNNILICKIDDNYNEYIYKNSLNSETYIFSNLLGIVPTDMLTDELRYCGITHYFNKDISLDKNNKNITIICGNEELFNIEKME